jgi:UDP-N-acetylmuramyl tripeptide synthase
LANGGCRVKRDIPTVAAPRFSPRLSLAILAGRGAGYISRRLGHGGTSLPGLVGLQIAPQLACDLARQLAGGVVLVAGTNGKTTTATMLAAALASSGPSIVHNQEGSNLLRGVATTLVRHADLAGRLRNAAHLMAVFEVDEAALPQVMRQTRPRSVLLTNLFRDQLDRYSEIALTAARWRTAIRSLPAAASLVLNADDPLIASLADAAPGHVVYFGVEEWPVRDLDRAIPAASADSLFCPRCSTALSFGVLAFAHLGHYRCPACDFQRPEPFIKLYVTHSSGEGSDVRVTAGDASATLSLRLPGRYNVYNAAAAIAGAVNAGVALIAAVSAVQTTPGAFGRAETLRVRDRFLRIFLIKNPTGADEVLRVAAQADPSGTLLLLLSDNAADGHDVSWIWDVNFEQVSAWTGPVICGGTRAEDLAVRLKYAAIVTTQVIPGAIGRAVQHAIQITPRGGAVQILATYTAMLAARDSLARGGYVEQYWQAAT